jgi:hypothetical protein
MRSHRTGKDKPLQFPAQSLFNEARHRCQNTWSNRGHSLYTVRSWEAKMEIPGNSEVKLDDPEEKYPGDGTCNPVSCEP